MALGRVAVGLGRIGARVLPASVRRHLDDRFFYSVFNVTRVTNDAYGWRPDDVGPQPRPDGWVHPWTGEE